MEYPDNFEVPSVEESTPVYPEKVAAEQAFYAASSYSTDPITDYNKMYGELTQKGNSELFNVTSKTWEQEQDVGNKVAIAEIIKDPTIDANTKKDILLNYSLGLGVSKSLKDKFSEKIASIEAGVTLKQRQSQDAQIKALEINKQKDLSKEKESFFEEATKDITDIATASGVVAFDFAKAIPLSLAGLYTAIKEVDAVEGQKVSRDLINKYRTGTLPKEQEEIRSYMEDKLSYLGKPGEWVREKLYDLTGNINTSITTSYFLDPLNLVTAGTGAAVLRGGVKGVAGAKKLVGIKPGTPAATAAISNPAQAAELLVGALEDTSGVMAKALGTTQGDIVADVLPKLDLGEDMSIHPDITNKIISNLEKSDAEFREMLDDITLDPNLHNVSEHIKDKQIIFETIKSTRGPTYMQNKSRLANSLGDLYEGVAVFGADSNYFFNNKPAVLRNVDILNESLKDLPDDLKGSVVVRDIITNETYLPEDFAKRSEFDSIENIKETVKTADFGYKKASKENPATFSNFIALKAANIPVNQLAVGDIFKNSNGTYFTVSDISSTGRVQLAIGNPVGDPKVIPDLQDIKYASKEQMATILKNVNKIVPEELLQVSDTPKQFAIEWNWKKTYNDTDALLFGDDAISARVGFGKFSFDLSKLARSSIANWIFNPGTAPEWFERSAARVSPREAKQTEFFIKKIKQSISTSPYKKELADLISEGMEQGKEIYSLRELSSKFSNLKQSDIAKLYETHVDIRRLIHYTHAYINYQKRFELYKDSFTRGLYVDGKYVGPVNDSLYFKVNEEVPKEVWSYDLDLPINFKPNYSVQVDPATGKNAVFDLETGKKLALLANPKNVDGKIYQYALVGTTRSTVDLLPDIVVPRTPGYFPRSYKEHFFIDRIPTEATVNGIKVFKEERLASYSETLGAATTRYEADQMLKELQEANKGKPFKIELRPAREADFGTVLTDYEVHGAMLRHAQHRGEHLPSVNGKRAKIVDPLLSLVKTVNSLSRTGTMMYFDDAVQKAFVKSYSEFLPNGEFPKSVNHIEVSGPMTETKAKKYQEAVTIFNRYAKLTNFDTMSAEFLRKSIYAVADVLESFKLPAGLVRDAANKAESIVNAPRKLAATLYISLFPQKQYIVQMATFAELSLLSPLSAPQLFSNALMVRGALLSEADSLKGISKPLQKAFQSSALGMDKIEFDNTVKAIKQSGLLPSIDLNMMVHGLFNETDIPLTETIAEKAVRYTKVVPKTIAKTSKAIGYDNAESINRIGIWLVAKDMWKKRNPNADWTTKKAIEEISYDEWSLSGSMSRSGSFKYQEGILSNFFQFAAISHKLTMNLFQDNATRLTDAQRFRLGLTRFAMWGSKYGLPLGEIMTNYIDSIENEKAKQILKTMEKGLIDRAVNGMISLITEESSDLNLSKNMGSYTKYGHPVFSLIHEMSTVWDGRPSTNPRFPVFTAWGSIGDTFGKFSGWYTTGELTVENWPKIAMEAASIAGGMSAVNKAFFMAEYQDKQAKLGNNLGLKTSTSDAIGQALGITTWREEALWGGINAISDRKAFLDGMGDDIHSQIVTLRRTSPGTWETDIQRLSSFFTMLKGDNLPQEDIAHIMNRVLDLDDRAEQASVGDSFILQMFKLNSDEADANVRKGLTNLEEFTENDPKIKELLELSKGTK